MSQIVANSIHTAAMIYLVGLSFSFIYAPTRIFHIAHAGVITVGGYSAYWLVVICGWSLTVALFAAVALGVTAGVVCELLVYRRMRRAGRPELGFLIASIGLYTVIQNCISWAFGDESHSLRQGTVLVGYKMGGAYLTGLQISIILSAVLAFVGFKLLMKMTAVGRAIKAISAEPELAMIYGINAERMTVTATAIGSGLGAVAGVFLGLDTNITPTMGFNIFVQGVVAMIVGGTGSGAGLVCSSLLLATAQHTVAYGFDPRWMDAVAYVVLILFLVIRPFGVAGTRLRRVGA